MILRNKQVLVITWQRHQLFSYIRLLQFKKKSKFKIWSATELWNDLIAGILSNAAHANFTATIWVSSNTSITSMNPL